jgi:sugar/nucleoside kinase (ribokinase family)
VTARVLVVGSVATDTIHNHLGTHPRVLGGSAVFGAIAASMFAPVRLVGVVGRDFPPDAMELLRSRGVDLTGLEVVDGKTFHWEGRYSDDLTSRTTLRTDLNVFADFRPKIPAPFRDSPYVMLGNIDPELQLDVLEQVERPRVVVADTMNFWIEGKLPELKALLARIDILTINEEEARQLSGSYNIARAARRLLEMGPKTVIIKRGEYGALLFHQGVVFHAPALPLEEVLDPTGAGDSFAGAFLAYLARDGGTGAASLRRAVIHGSAIASFCVEGIGVAKLVDLGRDEISRRVAAFQELVHFDAR